MALNEASTVDVRRLTMTIKMRRSTIRFEARVPTDERQETASKQSLRQRTLIEARERCNRSIMLILAVVVACLDLFRFPR